MEKGQIGYEYLSIVGIILLLIAPLVAFTLTTTSTQQTSTEAEITMSQLKSAAESVYSQGVGAKQRFQIVIPENSDLSSSTISGNIIRLRVRTGEGEPHDVIRIVDFNVTGNFPSTPGYHVIAVETLPTGVVQISSPDEFVCGNSIKEGTEECDGSDFGGQTCVTLGHDAGSLGCNSCVRDTSGCYNATFTYVENFTSHNGTVLTFDNAKSADDANLTATFTEEPYISGNISTLAISLAANEVVDSGTWSTVGNTFSSDDTDAETLTDSDEFEVGLDNTTESGTITSVVARIEQAVPVPGGGTDEFEIRSAIGGTKGLGCTGLSSSVSDSVLTCDLTLLRPGLGAWTFGDLNDTRILVNTNRVGAAPSSPGWTVDFVELDVDYNAQLTVHLLNITTYFFDVPTNITDHELQVRYNAIGDSFRLQFWNGSAFNTRGDVLNSTLFDTWTYDMTSAELNNGDPIVRIIDSNPNAPPQGILEVDYMRIRSL